MRVCCYALACRYHLHVHVSCAFMCGVSVKMHVCICVAYARMGRSLSAFPPRPFHHRTSVKTMMTLHCTKSQLILHCTKSQLQKLDLCLEILRSSVHERIDPGTYRFLCRGRPVRRLPHFGWSGQRGIKVCR